MLETLQDQITFLTVELLRLNIYIYIYYSVHTDELKVFAFNTYR